MYRSMSLLAHGKNTLSIMTVKIQSLGFGLIGTRWIPEFPLPFAVSSCPFPRNVDAPHQIPAV